MKTVGKQLQDARVAKGWSPELAARETKIRVDRLHDLEVDDYSNFSSPTYARGFVRTYARALGLDEYKILRQLDNKLPEDDNASFANDTGVPYMPEASKIAKPFEVGRGVYVAAAIGVTVLLLIGFILVQVYRAGYFPQAITATTSNPATNSVPAVPDTETAQRALPADTNAPPVALPVDTSSAVATAPASASAPAAPVDTNAPLRALPVDPATLGVPTAPAAVTDNTGAVPANNPNLAATAPASPAPAGNVAPSNAPAAPETSPAPTVPLDTPTPPRAQPVNLNALTAAPGGDTAASAPATDTGAVTTPAPTVQPRLASSVSARQSNARPSAPVVVTSDSPNASETAVTPSPNFAQATAPVDAANTSGPVVDDAGTPAPATTPPGDTSAPETASPQLAAQAPAEPPAADTAPAPSTLAPATPTPATPTETEPPAAAPDSTSALTGGDSAATGDASASPQNQADKNRGKRLVLTASHDSFVRVVALDRVHGDHVRFSSMLHSGQSISFNDRKYTINVGDPAVVDISLDGINYGPHSDHSEPDTFTVESRQP